MSLFARISDILSPPKASATPSSFHLPYNLTSEEWAALRSLPSSPGWDAFTKALDALAKLDGERILQSSNVDALHYLRGHVGGLRKASLLIAEIEAAERHHLKENEKREHGRAKRNPATLYGSPGWRSTDPRDAA